MMARIRNSNRRWVMRNLGGRVAVIFLISVAFQGCMLQQEDENEGLSHEEVSTQEIVPRGRYTCALPIKAGPCRAYFHRYAFDPATGLCVPFIYGGCGGNGNNFESYEVCQYRCGHFLAP